MNIYYRLMVLIAVSSCAAKILRVLAFVLILGGYSFSPVTLAEDYLSEAEFFRSVFTATQYRQEKLWLTEAQKTAAQAILGHPIAVLRVRYQKADKTSAWVLEEIGKEKPIKIGVAIRNGEILQVRILAFHESRGWEVKFPFFTDQFTQARLGNQWQLDKDIDGITGATLSVRAVTKVARLALYFESEVNASKKSNNVIAQ